MHSSEAIPPVGPPASGPALLLELGRLIVRARSASPVARDRLLQAKLLAAKPSTSQQVVTQPKSSCDLPKPGIEAQLSSRVQALWNEQIPFCIEVLLAPECAECYSSLTLMEEEANYDKLHCHQRALLLERWTMKARVNKSHAPAPQSCPWLVQAVRSQLHFSQLSAWRHTLQRRRKLSRETCNFKKLEANCDEEDLPDDGQKTLNIVYCIKIPGESYNTMDFCKPPTDHTFPITDVGNNISLKIVLESLPRIEGIPTVKCSCQKRRTSKETPKGLHEEIIIKLNDLSLGLNDKDTAQANRRMSVAKDLYNKDGEVLDDRMHTNCSENGKHNCKCDDESDNNLKPQETKKLDERRLKEIAKYKRRLRKESKLRKMCDSTSSEGDGLQKVKETHTSIPILQASRFDRFRAIGCYRNQTYLTLPASRIETKSPFLETVSIQPAEFKKTQSIATQTDDICQCGGALDFKCQDCKGMVRSEGNYDLASVNKEENGGRRKREGAETAAKKQKCDIFSSNTKCDINIVNRNSYKETGRDIIKRPKLNRVDRLNCRIGEIIQDRNGVNDVNLKDESDISELHLQKEDSVFERPKPDKRQKTYSISEDDYVLLEKNEYGTFDRGENGSPKDGKDSEFLFPHSEGKLGKDSSDSVVPSPTEMDRFRWRFDSAASMVFHTSTGLPLTSSPAPLRRGNNCFDFDDSINGISGIKSALFHPISPSSPVLPPPPPPQAKQKKLRIRPSTGLLGSFEESALKGRLEVAATVQGFTCELGASGAFCPPHRRLPVTVFFYAPGGTNAPYMGHINLGPGGYRVPRSGTIQVSLFNPHGTLVKMFVVLYSLDAMPPASRTFLRQRTLYLPAGAPPPPPRHVHRWLRYLIHLRFLTSKSGKLYLHTDIRLIVSRKADLDTATAHSALLRPLSTNEKQDNPTNKKPANQSAGISTNQSVALNSTNRAPNRVFGGCSEFDSELKNDFKEIGYENQNGVSYELRSFTYAPENPKYSPR